MADEKVGQEQVHDLLFGDKLGWQAIIYDLINSEQLNPWDIDISLLSNKYLEKVRELEEANFFVSSKVLLAASLLLRIKSEILLSQDIYGLDEILFGKKEEKKYVQERIELDDEIPQLLPRTPLPRFKKVTLPELMEALGKAMKTETRRIKREILFRQQERETDVVIPKDSVNLKQRIQEIYDRLKGVFVKREEKIAFSELVSDSKTREEKIISFVSLLHLDNQQKVWLEQEGHFEEIWILLKDIYERQNKDLLEQKMREVEEAIAQMGEQIPEEPIEIDEED